MAPEREPLTREQVKALPEGTPITVIWSGGNGPHRYSVTVDDFGRRYAASDGMADRFYNPLTFVGQQFFHTRVWPAEDHDDT